MMRVWLMYCHGNPQAMMAARASECPAKWPSVAVRRGKTTETLGEVVFCSDFDSGNLDRVEECRSELSDVVEYNIWTAPDCAGSPCENGNRSWFYFSVTTPPSFNGKTIRLNIQNLNKQCRLYQQGYTALIKLVPGRDSWERLNDRPETEVANGGMRLSFKYCVKSVRKQTAYFAFCYPFSYDECQKALDDLDIKFSCTCTCTCLTGKTCSKDASSIYYHRELLCYSLDGLRIDLITVSSHHGITDRHEDRLRVDGLFPDKSSYRARKFEGKKVFMLTSRVHPGETPSSHVFNGFLNFILKEDDPRATTLRKYFVFKLVPLLNPDGVKRGHYRTDCRGVNLNRMYLQPDITLHPSVYAVRQLVMYHHAEGFVHLENELKNESNITSLNSSNHLTSGSTPTSGVAAYVDLHAHATKRGCFMYGNHFKRESEQIESILFPKLVSLNSIHFDFDQCVFSEKNMYVSDKRDGLSKEGSGRVALYKATGIIHSYTLECNYNCGRRCNILPPCMADERASRQLQLLTSTTVHKYAISDFEEVGRGLAVALLDLFVINPWCRLPASEFGSLSGVRQSILQWIKSSKEPSLLKLRRPLRQPMLQPAKTECGEMKQEEAKFDLMHRSLKGTSEQPSVTVGPKKEHDRVATKASVTSDFHRALSRGAIRSKQEKSSLQLVVFPFKSLSICKSDQGTCTCRKGPGATCIDVATNIKETFIHDIEKPSKPKSRASCQRLLPKRSRTSGSCNPRVEEHPYSLHYSKTSSDSELMLSKKIDLRIRNQI